ncbi:hypothetical protein AHAS_Ahas07G0039800 [Arachis hypogaea]
MCKGNPQRRSTGDELHTVAKSGDLVAVQMILTSNPLAVNSRDKHLRTPLHLEAFAGHAEIVSYLCKNKADVGASAMDDMAAIHFATQKGHLEVVKALVAAVASNKACTRKGMNSLHYAAQGSIWSLLGTWPRKGRILLPRQGQERLLWILLTMKKSAHFWRNSKDQPRTEHLATKIKLNSLIQKHPRWNQKIIQVPNSLQWLSMKKTVTERRERLMRMTKIVIGRRGRPTKRKQEKTHHNQKGQKLS